MKSRCVRLGSMCKKTPSRGILRHQDRCLNHKSCGPRSSSCGVKVGIDGSMQVLPCSDCDLSGKNFARANCRTNLCILENAKVSPTSCISRKNWTDFTPINSTTSRQNFWTQMLMISEHELFEKQRDECHKQEVHCCRSTKQVVHR